MELKSKLVHHMTVTDHELNLMTKCLALALGMTGVSVKSDERAELKQLNVRLLDAQKQSLSESLNVTTRKREKFDDWLENEVSNGG